MKKILFVEDDALITRIYAQKLVEAGFEVALAADGLEATKKLLQFKPDLMVLDLLMPKFNGPDVLKFMRQHAELKSIRVIVFTNSFLSHLVDQISTMGVERTLVKASATPSQLIVEIEQVLAGPQRATAGPSAPAKPATLPPPPAPLAPLEDRPRHPPADTTPRRRVEGHAEFDERMTRQFHESTPVIFMELRQLCRESMDATDAADRAGRLVAMQRKLGFLTQMAAMAGYHGTAELSSALEALIFELLDKPANFNESCQQTIIATIAFLGGRFQKTQAVNEHKRSTTPILVVDDDALTNRAVVMSLVRAQFRAKSFADPLEALQELEHTAYGLALLDISMPGMDGLTLCEKMAALPLNHATPVIFVTGHSDFKTRARSILSGGKDLITKPILPSELCVKVIMHLLQAG